MSSRVTATVYTSHVPAMGVAIDQGLTGEPYWAPVFAGFEPGRRWIADHTPERMTFKLPRELVT